MFQAITLIAVVLVTGQAFDLKKTKTPMNSLVNLGKIDVNVYYNTPNAKSAADRMTDVQPMSNSVFDNDIPPLNDLFKGALPMAPLHPGAPSSSCPCSQMKSFGQDSSFAVLNKLFGGISMANDVPQSPKCCELFEIIEEDAMLPLNGNFLDLEPSQINILPLSPLSPPKSNSQFKPKAVEIVILPNKKTNKFKHMNSARDDIKVVSGKNKFPKYKKAKSQGTMVRSGDKSASRPTHPSENIVINIEKVVETNPTTEPGTPSLASSESGKNPSVKKDLNSEKTTTLAPPTIDDVTTTKTSASPADVDVQ